MNFPIDGVVSINNEGSVRVSLECADLMVKSGAGWDYADGDAPVVEEVIEETIEAVVEETVEEVVEEVIEEATEEVVEEAVEEEVTVDFKSMSKDDLKQVLKDAGAYDGKKHGRMGQAKLIKAIETLMK